MRRMTLALLALLALSSCALGEIIWFHKSLDGEPSHPPVDVDYVNWDSISVALINDEKSVIIKSSDPEHPSEVHKDFSTSIPHAYLIVQAQYFQQGCLSEGEGFTLQISNSPITIDRIDSANEFFGCEEGQVQTYIQRYTFPHSDKDFSVLLTSNVSEGEVLSFNNFRLGVIGCEPTCAKCTAVENPQTPYETVCTECPENSTWNTTKEICECNATFEADMSNGYLICNSETSGEVDDGEISTACRNELNSFSSRTRVNIITTEEQGEEGQFLQAHIDYYHFFSALSASCGSLLRVKVKKYNDLSESYSNLESAYIKDQVLGDFVNVAIDLDQFPALANSIVEVDGKTVYTIHLALQFKVGSQESRIHDFNLINQVSGESHEFSSFNLDYQLNMNFISPISTFNNPAAFVKEYLFDIKRYLCVDSSCVLSREFQGYDFNEEIIVKIQFRSNQNKQHLNLIESHVFGNDQEFNSLSDVTVLTSGDGFLILSLPQKYITTLINNSQATNKAYLQFTVTYHDDANDVNSKLRYGQAVILFYALYHQPV